MTFVRKRNKIPVFCCFLLDSLYREILILIIMILIDGTIDLLNRENPYFITHLDSIFSDAELWIYPMMIYFMVIGHSIRDIRSAVTRITIDDTAPPIQMSPSIHIEYYAAWSLFLKKKTKVISFAEFGYYIENTKEQKFYHYICPSHPEIDIQIFQKGKFCLTMNCNIGWTRQQFAEIIKALNDIVPPDDKLYVW